VPRYRARMRGILSREHTFNRGLSRRVNCCGRASVAIDSRLASRALPTSLP
jgi:hypothetical protein